ncbi:MAG: hypothetical protein WDW38_000995 [Sanguina aurantia]
MGERKVLNKYYPPDYDPSKMPRGKKNESNDMKVRMMLPMSVRCKTCRNFMYKGTKFNTRKEDVMGETYLGIQVFRFYYRCTNCAAEFTMKTDPEHQDYMLEEGASRNHEPWREPDLAKAAAIKEREDEEMGNAMKALENRTLDSKREMDIMAALDEMRTLKSQHARISTEAALAALSKQAQQEDGSLDENDLDSLKEFYQLRDKAMTANKNLQGDTSDDSSGGGGSPGPIGSSKPSAGGRGGVDSKPPAAGGSSSATDDGANGSGSSKRPMQQQGQRQTALQMGSGTAGGAGAGKRSRRDGGGGAEGGGAGAKAAGRPTPVQLLPLRVMIKPKKVVLPTAAVAVMSSPASATEGAEGGSGSPAGGGLMGLGGYGSGSEDSQ